MKRLCTYRIAKTFGEELYWSQKQAKTARERNLDFKQRERDGDKSNKRYTGLIAAQRKTRVHTECFLAFAQQQRSCNTGDPDPPPTPRTAPHTDPWPRLTLLLFPPADTNPIPIAAAPPQSLLGMQVTFPAFRPFCSRWVNTMEGAKECQVSAAAERIALHDWPTKKTKTKICLMNRQLLVTNCFVKVSQMTHKLTAHTLSWIWVKVV